MKDEKVKFRTDGNIAIHVTDLKTAEDFYGNVLVFKLIDKTEKYLMFNTSEIILYVNSDTKILPYIPAMEVSDFNIAKQKLLNNGCTIIEDSIGKKSGYFKDPFGIIFDVIENS